MNSTDTSKYNKISLKEKLAYGVGGVARGLQSSMDNMLITPVFVLGVGISPTVKSMCDILYRVFDAFTDVFTGILSDNARTRWGRRRPFIFAGSILMAISMPILFLFNPDWPMGWIIFWMVCATLFIFLAQTIFDVPFQAFLLESSEDTKERMRLFAFTAYFGQHDILPDAYPKGRDWYDLIWYRGQLPPTEPNLDMLQNALDQTQGRGILNAAEWRILLRDRIESLDTAKLVADVRPFLERPVEADLFTRENFLSLPR